MKRFGWFLISVLLCAILSFTTIASAESPRLYDSADLLTDAQESEILSRLDEVSEAYKVEVVIATVETVGDYTTDEYVSYFYDGNGYGYGSGHDGVLLLVTMAERDYRILSNGLGAKAISSDDIDEIGERIQPSLTDGDYADAFTEFVDECEYQINGEINGFPFDYTKNILISLAIGFVLAFVITSSMKAKLKSVRKQEAAAEYTKQGSMRLVTSNDLFLYRTVNRTKRQTESSGSSSASRNVGGGKF